MYSYIYTYTYVYTYINTHTYVYTYIYIFINVHIYVTCIHTYICMVAIDVQGVENPHNALSLEVIFRKRALKFVALFWEEVCNLRHLMHRHHPVLLIYLDLVKTYNSG